jgi:TonB family protein
LRSNWNRPADVADDDFVAEVEVSVDRAGRISNPEWKKSSGDARWDDSVRAAIAATKGLDRPPPANFPAGVLVRFDIQEETEPVLQ